PLTSRSGADAAHVRGARASSTDAHVAWARRQRRNHPEGRSRRRYSVGPASSRRARGLITVPTVNSSDPADGVIIATLFVAVVFLFTLRRLGRGRPRVSLATATARA